MTPEPQRLTMDNYHPADPWPRIAYAISQIELMVEVNKKYPIQKLESERLTAIGRILNGLTTPKEDYAKVMQWKEDHEKDAEQAADKWFIPRRLRPWLKKFLSDQ